VRGSCAVYRLCLGSETPQGRAVAPSAISTNHCALSSRRRLDWSLIFTRVCMRWPRKPTLSFLGGPAEVQPFGPLRVFLAGELSNFQRRAGGLYGLLGGIPLARRQLGVQGGYARRGGAHWSRCARGASSDCFPAEKKVGVVFFRRNLTLCIFIYIIIIIHIERSEICRVCVWGQWGRVWVWHQYQSVPVLYSTSS